MVVTVLASSVRSSVELGLLLLALCVLIGPVLAERFRIPGLVGLIAVGMVLGPNVLEWLHPAGFVATVGAAGLLYLMFLAGLELDLKTFRANRNAALTLGFLTFGVPFTLAYAVGAIHLDLGASGAALVGAMWASHTVVAYPEAKAAGLDRNRAVGSAVAATVITDILALVILAVAASSAALEGEAARASTEEPPLPLPVGIVAVAVFCLVVLPRLTRWVFTRIWHTRTQRFVWMLAGMAAGAVVGLLGGIEGLVGAFLAGIGMNAVVPARSELMERVEFVGSALLVPAFLVSVGLAIDPSALVEPSTLRLAAIFTTVVVVGKVLSAVIAGRLFDFSWPEITIVATLTIGQAAATLAISQVGVATGLFDLEILNAAVVTVVATVLITSFGTRWAARRVEGPTPGTSGLGEHVLVEAPTERAAGTTAELVSALTRPDAGLATPFVPCPADDDDLNGDLTLRLGALEAALTQLGHDTDPVTRVGETTASATLGLAREQAPSLVVVQWEARPSTLLLPTGNHIDAVGAGSTQPCLAARLSERPWTRILVVTGRAGRFGSRRADLELVAEVVARIRAVRDAPLTVYAPGASEATPFTELGDAYVLPYRPRTGTVVAEIQPDDLVVVPAHVVADAGVVERWRIQQALSSVSLLVVGGPGRLAVSLTRRDSTNAGMGMVKRSR